MKSPLSLGILGISGRMSRSILEALEEEKSLSLTKGLYHTKRPNLDPAILTKNPQDVFKNCDIILDFSHPDCAEKNLDLAAQFQKPFLLGTTGFDKKKVFPILKKCSSQAPLLYAPNTSFGACILKNLIEKASSFLDKDFDVTILDKHHRGKKDRPSGTSLSLENAIIKGWEGIQSRTEKKRPTKNIEHVSLRAGQITGTHEVSFINAEESLSLKHVLFSRRPLAKGAICAALWLSTQPSGLYSMDNVLQSYLQ